MRTTFSPTIPRALVGAFLALSGAMLSLTPGTATAAAPARYSASLMTALAEPKQAILNESLWKCAGDSCSAPDLGGRPTLVCQQVARKFGPIAAFTSAGGALSADELTKCNKR